MALQKHEPERDVWADGLTWGDCLRIKVAKSGGLKHHVERIQLEAGDIPVGSRNTFAKLFDLDEPPADRGDRFRAWALLVSVGVDPEEWGVFAILPDALSVTVLKQDFDGAGRDERRRRGQGKPRKTWIDVLAGNQLVAA